MRPYDLVTFDCYGTLIDWEAGLAAAMAPLARRHAVRGPVGALVERYLRLEFSLEQGAYRPYREILAEGLALVFAERGARLGAAESRALVRSLPRWAPFPEARGVLSRLKRAGYRLAVLSNIDDSLLRGSLRRIGVEFDFAVTAQQVRSYKPRARHWERALRRARVPKERVFHVGASVLHDIIPARALGLRCVWIARNGQGAATTPRLSGVRPDHIFKDLRPLLGLLVGERGAPRDPGAAGPNAQVGVGRRA